ncbi:ABC transporter permease [Mycolicibacterium phlei]
MTLTAVVVAVLWTEPLFRGSVAVYSTLEGMVLLGIVAAGVSATMIAGELDLSVGSMASLAGVVVIRLGDLGLVPAILATTLICLAIGTLQGYLIARLQLSSLVLTVGTLIVLQGAAWLVAGGRPVSLADLEQTDLLLAQLGVVTPASLIAVLVIAALGVFLARTRPGRELYATGGARIEATAAGIPVRRSVTLAFAISGSFAGLAGALTCMQGGSADPGGFASVLLAAVAACLIGGVSLSGGRGTMVHVVLGVMTLTLLSSGMTAAGVKTAIINLVTGLLLLAVVTVNYALGRLVTAHNTRQSRRRLATVPA